MDGLMDRPEVCEEQELVCLSGREYNGMLTGVLAGCMVDSLVVVV